MLLEKEMRVSESRQNYSEKDMSGIRSQPAPVIEDVSPDVETKVDVTQLNPFVDLQQHAASSASRLSPSSHLSHSSRQSSPAPSPGYDFRH
jgi:hypothetical protein